MRMAAQLLSTEVRDLVTGPMNYYRRDMVILWLVVLEHTDRTKIFDYLLFYFR